MISFRAPVTGDIVDCYDKQKKEWYRVVLDSDSIKYWPHYHNCTFPTGKKGGVYLYTGELWSLVSYDHDDVVGTHVELVFCL